jgi:adenylate cyclase
LAVEPESRITLPPVSPGASPTSLEPRARAVDTQALARDIPRRFSMVLPVINLVEAALTYIFIVYVVPLPGHERAHADRTTLIAMGIVTGLAWATCQLWGTHMFRPVRQWLMRGGEPDEAERNRVVRIPLLESGQTFAVWTVAGAGFGVISALMLSKSATAGALVGAMVVIGGLVASALTYLAVERIMRPVTALALEHATPECPLVPGIAARIYLAWEFGTAVAVWGIAVAAIAYLAGAPISGHKLAVTVSFLAAIALGVGVVTLLVAIRSVADPVRAVRRAMAQVEEGETDVKVPIDDGGEVGLLQAGFNRMVAGLRERDLVQDLFGRHVGEEVARSALARGVELGGELREAAVLFVDVIGSTPFAFSHDPREVVRTLNRFFGIADEVVTVHGGWVNKFEGDCALCVFGAPTEHPDAAGAALAAGRELQRRLARELDGLEAAIGLSAGKVVAGNVGTARRYEYTVIGDPVNEAARLMEQAKTSPPHLLASEAIISRARPSEADRWRLGEPVKLRGRDAATRVAVPA